MRCGSAAMALRVRSCSEKARVTGCSSAELVSYKFQRLMMIGGDEPRTCRMEPLAAGGIGGETDEGDFVGDAGIKIVEVVADIDDAVFRQSGLGDSARENIALAPAAVGAVRVPDEFPQIAVDESQARRVDEVGSGDAERAAHLVEIGE